MRIVDIFQVTHLNPSAFPAPSPQQMSKVVNDAVSSFLQMPPPTLALVSAAAGAGVVLAVQTAADFRAWSQFAYNVPFMIKPLIYPLVYIARWTSPGKGYAAKLLQSEDTTTFLRADFPHRRGPLPQMPKWPFPNRHIPQLHAPEHTAALEARLRAAATTHNLLLARSRREGMLSTALYSQRADAAAPLHAHDRLHVHVDDGSAHVSLPPRDAGALIAKGWAAPFPLAGRASRFGMDPGLVLVFTPRDEEELKLVLEIIDAGVQFNLTKLPKE